MRRLASMMLLVTAAGPAAAQPVTVPAPDFDNDGFGALAVGAPGEDVGDAADAGAVAVRYGSADGPDPDGQVLVQGAGGVPGASEAGDRFGAALVTGQFNADAYADLAVGAPGETVGGRAGASAVSVLFGAAATGLGGAGAELLHQGAGGLGGAAEPGDAAGAGLG